jgi:hypothetical protein
MKIIFAILINDVYEDITVEQDRELTVNWNLSEIPRIKESFGDINSFLEEEDRHIDYDDFFFVVADVYWRKIDDLIHPVIILHGE